MTNVYDMNGRRPPMVPKRETHRYQGQQYELVFDPNARPDEQWVWIVRYTEVFTFTGSTDSISKASTAARKKIRELTSER